MNLLRAGRALLQTAPCMRPISSRVLSGKAWSGSRRRNGDEGPPVNAALRQLREVRLVSESGADQGLMSGAAAYARARAAGLDLMQVYAGGTSAAPVVRIVDYGAYQDTQRRRRYEASRRKKQTGGGASVRLKQVRLSPSTGPHDLAIKLKQARAFLADGHCVRVYMQFRRGQGRLKDEAKASLVGVAHELAPHGRLRGVESVDDVHDLFKEPPPDSNASPDAPRRMKPLEIHFDPLSKQARDKVSKEEVQAGSGAKLKLAPPEA